MTNYWSPTKTQVLSELRTDGHHGLTQQEARRRLNYDGFNELKKTNQSSALALLARQLNSPFVYILVLAAIITAYQQEWAELVVIVAVIIANTAVGFFEEYKAEQTISKLRGILSLSARVIRESVEQKIPARYLVPGDIVLLEAGDRVPADARILDARSLAVNQAPLTGESVPSHKRDTIVSTAAALIDRHNVLYSSTLVVSGQATAVVVKTGMSSELGGIAREVTRVKDEPSDLKRKLESLGKWLTILALGLSLVVFIIGSRAGLGLLEMFRTTLALLVSIVPEGLPIALTVALSVGLTRLFRHHVLIRQLAATETLGSITTLGVDKTGTLTEGTMMVEKIVLPSAEITVSGKGFSLTGSFYQGETAVDVSKNTALTTLLELTSLATSSTISKGDLLKDRAKQLTDPTETALAVVAAKGGYYSFENEREWPELLELPFDQELRYGASVHRVNNRYRVIVKGSLERVFSLSEYILDKKPRRLLAATRAKFLEQAEALADDGYRVVALAYADYPTHTAVEASMVRRLTLVGLLALVDPIRPEAALAIKRAQDAGLRTVMITGDHLLTATHIARKLGLDLQGEIIHAQDLDAHDLSKVAVIARASPKDKLMIVERLQRHGELVAMTGDGINDAPALKKADIGVAMGRTGSDIAIETSDIVLLDDNFDGILQAVAQGRLIWENVKKVVYYLVSTNLGEVLTIIGALLLRWPLPLVAVQILWLNLVTDGVTSMALTVEPAEESLMTRMPRDPKETIVSGSASSRMILVSLVMAIGTLVVFSRYSTDLVYARSAALTTLVFFQLFNLFNSRSASRSVFATPLGSNRLLLATFGLASLLQLGAIYWPTTQHFLGLTALDGSTVVFCLAIALSVVAVDELRKFLRLGLLSWAKTQAAFR